MSTKASKDFSFATANSVFNISKDKDFCSFAIKTGLRAKNDGKMMFLISNEKVANLLENLKSKSVYTLILDSNSFLSLSYSEKKTYLSFRFQVSKETFSVDIKIKQHAAFVKFLSEVCSYDL